MNYEWQIVDTKNKHYTLSSPEISDYLDIFENVKNEDRFSKIFFTHKSGDIRFPIVCIDVDKDVQLVYEERDAIELPWKYYHLNPLDSLDMFYLCHCDKYAVIGFIKNNTRFISIINLNSGLIKLINEDIRNV